MPVSAIARNPDIIIGVGLPPCPPRPTSPERSSGGRATPELAMAGGLAMTERNNAFRNQMLNYIIQQIIENNITKPKKLDALKRRSALKFKKTTVSNMKLLETYHQLVGADKIKQDKNIEELLQTTKIRTLSGVAIITVLTKPYPCPGKCLYCPNEKGMPKSYLSNEPAAMRAALNKFDPYKQVKMRLNALEKEGHKTDKIELIVLGGTWSVYPEKYQNWFIKECFRACNKNSKLKTQIKNPAYVKTSAGKQNLQQLKKLLHAKQKRNETAGHRIIGLTLETRPDHINPEEIIKMRELGCTRVELGVQSIYNDVLKINKRGHNVQTTIQATKLLKDVGFKINYHIMPNLPGSNLKKDEKMFETLFSNSDFQPDLLKIYPCAVLKNSPLFAFWKAKKYKPYTENQLINLLIKVKKIIPPYVRIQRIIRDIPSNSIIAGNKVTNLRQLIDKMPDKMCQCIRCREVKNKYSEQEAQKIKLFRYDYDASDGKEIFLSFESPNQQNLYALLRLRIPSQYFSKKNPTLSIPPLLKGKEWEGLNILKSAAIIREVHTYGEMIGLAEKKKAPQHKGLGKKLIAEAEKITAKEFGINKIAVISGIGVREYYKKLGYKLRETYMIKILSNINK